MYNLTFKTKDILISVVIGIFAGLSSSLFLHLLKLLTNLRLANQWLIFLLPFVGFFIGWVFHKWGSDIVRGNHLVMDEIHAPQKTLPLKMAPFILFGTLLTHLFGGSAGREGTAVQMSASLADGLSNTFKNITKRQRRIFLVAGAGAGFGAAVGAPLAGALFGLEILNIGRLKVFGIVQCLIASFVGYYISVLLLTPHTIFAKLEIPLLNLKYIFFTALAGIFFGMIARVFSMITHFIERLNSNYIQYPPLRPFIAGVVLVLFYYIEGSYQYAGLGLEYINLSLSEASLLKVPFLKMLFTAITVGSGFKGGEFIPLVYMGATFGSFLSTILPVPIKLLSALGIASVFGAAANAPISCAIMAIELFGLKISIYAFVCCYFAYLFSGYKGIYTSQKILNKKLKFVNKPKH